jgi:Xaa-Pro aminopeptidase
MSKNKKILLLLEQLRDFLRLKNYAACIIPQNDPHMSEYVADYYKIREAFSGFTGSAGTLVVGMDFAILWTDGRYFLQAESQLEGAGIELYRSGVENVPTLEEFLEKTVGMNGVVVANSNVISANDWEKMKEKFNISHDAEWEGIWKNRPKLKKSNIWRLDWAENEYPSLEKINKIRNLMYKEGVDYYLVSTLDEFSWLFNLRADDIDYTPVVRGFAIIGAVRVMIFIDAETPFNIEGVEVYHYNSVLSTLSSLNGKIWLDKERVNALLYNVCCEKFDVFTSESPIILMKTAKTRAELDGFRRANINDGVVWVRLIKYLEDCLLNGERITELSVARKIEQLKASFNDFVSESFESVVAYGSNAAIVHYAVNEETDKEILPEGFLLIDSGTHYIYGTTDITRTLVCGEFSTEQRVRFTQVLQGMIAVAVAEFDKETTGAQIDELARQFLKKDGCDYRHGTGHGVGSVMCVHEDGVKFSPKFLKPIVVGAVSSDEPGYYKDGEFGIRIENMLYCKELTDNKLGFETLTLVPIDLEAIELSLLTDGEKEWINNYHKNIKQTLKNYLSQEEFLWLENKYYEI